MSPLLGLSLDGGGIRGYLQALLILRTSEQIPDLLERLQAVSGTSIGSICASWIAAGKPIDELVQLLEDEVDEVFRRWYGLPRWRWVPWVLGSLRKPRYQSTGLARLLHDHFGSLRLRDLEVPVVITAYDLRAKSARHLTSFVGDSDREMLVVDACMCSAAAPVYFQPHLKMADGGLWANHPGWRLQGQLVKREKVKLENSWLLSIGTGEDPSTLDVSGDAGAAEWLSTGGVFEGSMGGSSSAAHQDCEIFLDERYCRVQPKLPRPMALDDVDCLPELKEIAKTAELDHVISWWARFTSTERFV